MRSDVKITPRSLTVRLGVFFGVLLALPFVLFLGFHAADQQKSRLVLKAVEQEGLIIVEGLRDILADFSARSEATSLDAALERFAGGDRNLKLFYQPSGEVTGFFRMAASPTLSPSEAAAERDALDESGLFSRLTTSCVGGEALAQRFQNPLGQEEVLTSITPIDLPNGCWVLLVSHASDAYLGTSLGRPFWTTAAVQIAVLSYVLIALIGAWLLWDVRRDLKSIARAARGMRAEGQDVANFASQIRMPELNEMTAELDRLLETLAASQDLMRRAAEENAHALKTPIAIIEQSLEPLRAIQPEVDNDSARAIDVIGQATERLDGLVSAARTLDTVAADSLDAARTEINLSDFVARMASSFQPVASARGVAIHCEMEDKLEVQASEEAIETVFENLFENALGFSPQGGVIKVVGRGLRETVAVAVLDDGPGVKDGDLERIFERYYSARAKTSGDETVHFGLGLWIVRRNIEALRGTVTAQNRPEGGLEVAILLPGSHHAR